MKRRAFIQTLCLAPAVLALKPELPKAVKNPVAADTGWLWLLSKDGRTLTRDRAPKMGECIEFTCDCVSADELSIHVAMRERFCGDGFTRTFHLNRMTKLIHHYGYVRIGDVFEPLDVEEG